MGDLSFLELGDVPPFTAPAATAAIPGRMSDVNCRDTARVPSCNRFWVGVSNPSIYGIQGNTTTYCVRYIQIECRNNIKCEQNNTRFSPFSLSMPS